MKWHTHFINTSRWSNSMANNAIDMWPAAFYAKRVRLGILTGGPNRYGSILRCPKCGLTGGLFTQADDIVTAAIEFDREHTKRCNNALHQARQSL
jgi:hypothetical protein